MIWSTEPGESRERSECDDKDKPDEQRGLRADARGQEAREEHHAAGDEQVAGEQQHRLGGRGIEFSRDGRQDRVDQPMPMKAMTAANTDLPRRHVADGGWTLPPRCRRVFRLLWLRCLLTLSSAGRVPFRVVPSV